MRIWSIHPKYLDSKGLVALWRETLLAQNVLLGKTKGYKNHPQLNRFKSHSNPIDAIGYYLHGIYKESTNRGYNFNKDKIISSPINLERIPVTTGQSLYELEHLKNKLKSRDPKKYDEISDIATPDIHLLFYIIKGDIEDWKAISAST